MSQQNLYTLSLDSVKYICSLINKTVDLPNTILDDLNIQTTTTYSSYRLDTLLKALKDENIKYCDEAIAGLNKLTKEIVDDSSKVVKENTIYLILTNPVNNVYEQWLLINGTPQMIGTTEMKLDSVYTKQEADARYTLLTDFNTLKTKVDGKVDKTDIVDSLTSTDIDKPLSANQGKVLKDEVDLKANDNEVVKKTDISTTIDSTSTNDKVAGAKAVNDKLSQYVRIDGENMLLRCTSSGTVFTDFIDKNCTSNFRAYHVVWNSLVSGTPCGDGYCTVYTYDDSLHKKAIAYNVSGNAVWEITQLVGVWGTWQQVRSGVTDVPITYINTFENETYVKPTRNDVCSYYVTNGFCTVTIEAVCLSTSDNFVQILSGLPKPKTTVYSNTIDRQMGINSGARATFQLTPDGRLRVVCNYGDPAITEAFRNFYVTISYPVAES